MPVWDASPKPSSPQTRFESSAKNNTGNAAERLHQTIRSPIHAACGRSKVHLHGYIIPCQHAPLLLFAHSQQQTADNFFPPCSTLTATVISLQEATDLHHGPNHTCRIQAPQFQCITQTMAFHLDFCSPMPLLVEGALVAGCPVHTNAAHVHPSTVRQEWPGPRLLMLFPKHYV